MKKLIFLSLATLLCLVAPAQEIRDIETTVRLFRNGNALVVQKWDIRVTQGTEWYIPIDNPGKSRIGEFSVFEDGEEFDNDGDRWKSDRSMRAKSHRCGIIRKPGGNLELCWGLGSHGDHVFTIMYVIENLVQDYGEVDGFHWHFLNDEWSVKPQHASITFLNETDAEKWVRDDTDGGNVRFWGFGMAGKSSIEDGVITFESTEPFGYASFFSALMCFDKGLFLPSVRADGTMAELKKEAFRGSDYDVEESDDYDVETEDGTIIVKAKDGERDKEEDKDWIYYLIALLALPVLLVAYLIYKGVSILYWKLSGHRYDKSIFGKTKIEGWWRDLPVEGNPTALYSLLFKGDKLATNPQKRFPNLAGAYFLKWILDGLLVVEKDPKKSKRVNLRFVKGEEEISFDDAMERQVYLAALEAAGSNLLLEANEFKKWSYKHYNTAVSWPWEAVYLGRNTWAPLSKEERCHAVEFKHFLEDFTLMDQRNAPEVGLWKKYMVLAAAMGIADQVAKNFEKLYPNVMEEYSRNANMLDMSTTYMILREVRVSSTAMMKSAAERNYAQKAAASAQARRSFGGGGSISIGGGFGGFGGGHGGGAR
ncbi:MAG: DUF2207 domain-containing protein [Bacteroidales bacterium]|nr:DUF2207 domain-containing protein [Bacteroidales bacterium]